jgi:hypothetical protein
VSPFAGQMTTSTACAAAASRAPRTKTWVTWAALAYNLDAYALHCRTAARKRSSLTTSTAVTSAASNLD